MKLSLFAKIVVSFLLATAIPIAIFFFFAEKTSTDILRSDVYGRNRLFSKQVSNQLDVFVIDLENILKSLNSAEAIKENDAAGMVEVLESYYQNFVAFGERTFETFVVLDKDGVVKSVYPYKEEYIGLNYAHFDYYREIAAGQEKYISPNVWVSPITGRSVVEIAFPAKNSRGETVAIVSANINLATITRVAQELKLGKQSAVFILDKSGVFVAHPETSLVVERQNINNVYPGLFAVIKSKEEGEISWPEDKPKFIFNWYTSPTIGWKVVSAQEIKEALAVSDTLRRLFGYLLGAILLLIGAVSYFISRRIVTPVKKLSRGLEEIAKGNLDMRIEIKTGDEIESLGDNFNVMAAEIKDYQGKLKSAYEVEKKARMDLEKLDEAKDQFVLITQHHLRTPLTIMKGYIYSILSEFGGRLEPKIVDYLGKVSSSTDRLVKMVNEFLDISQFQVGKSILKLAPVNLKTVILEIIDELQPEIQKKNLFVRVVPEAEWPELVIDREKLKQAVFNLIDNAIKYTEKGGVTVSFEEQKDKTRIILAVQDTGIGLTEEEITGLFSRFFERGEKAKTLFATGRGIGLFVAANIVKMHGGRMWATSEGRGKGSTFYIELPYKSEIR